MCVKKSTCQHFTIVGKLGLEINQSICDYVKTEQRCILMHVDNIAIQ